MIIMILHIVLRICMVIVHWFIGSVVDYFLLVFVAIVLSVLLRFWFGFADNNKTVLFELFDLLFLEVSRLFLLL